MPRVFLLDAMGLAYRAFHALVVRRPKSAEEIEAQAAAEGKDTRDINPYKWEPLKNSRGEPTNAVYGFANTVLKVRRQERPDFWALAWDGPGPTYRHRRYAEYKATRKPMPDDLLQQMPAIEELAQALGLPVIEVPGVEADDVMGTLARRAEQEGLEVVLVTSDKDMLQLVGDRVRLLSPVARGEDYTWVDRDAVRQKWGVDPEQIRDVFALMGDSIDNVPGVKGVGQKTAVELIVRFGSLEALYARLGEVEKTALREKLRAAREQAFLSQELVTVRTDCDLSLDWEALRCAPMRRASMIALAERHELVRLRKVAEELGQPESEAGPPVLARPAERRGTAAGRPSPRVALAEPAEEIPRAPEAPAPAWEVLAFGDEPSDPPPVLPEEAARDARGSGGQPAQAVERRNGSGDPTLGPPAAAVERAFEPSAAARQERLDLWAEAGAAFGPDEWVTRLHAVRGRAIHGLALLPVATEGGPRGVRLVGLALAARDGTTCYVPLGHAPGPNLTAQETRDWLALAMADPTLPKVGVDLKRDAHLLEGAGLVLGGFAFDLHIGSFLCDPMRDHSLEGLARDFLAVDLSAPDAATNRGVAAGAVSPIRPRAPETLPPDQVAPWAERAVATLYPLADHLRTQLESRRHWGLYQQLEHPLIAVLLDMERAGILVDLGVLAEMRTRVAHEIERLEEELYALAGERFNLNSGLQLSRILFEKLKLKTGRRTKTGFSTDQAVLEELAASHEFPARLLEYRALAKLQSTYLEALPQVVDPRDRRVHTTFHQAGAATGRLSSSDPNLQNIPIRTPQGRAIRRAFVAPAGSELVGADYSQIELRIMAHLSGDPALIEAFHTGEDVHASTARRIFGIASGELDPALRARAKIVNFGIMYGMGARSLSQQMGIGLPEAQEFIANYFRVYSRVRAFLDSTLDEARRRGYVQTLGGRRRYLPELVEGHGAERALAERVAVNTPIQGSAADLMKLAMIRVHRALMRSFASARLLLQVHDELLLEAPRGDSEAVSERVRIEMEGCLALRVPLVVSTHRGPTWFDVH